MKYNINNNQEKELWITEATVIIAASMCVNPDKWVGEDELTYKTIAFCARCLAEEIYDEHQRIREEKKKQCNEDPTKSYSHSNPKPDTRPPKPEPPKNRVWNDVLKDKNIRQIKEAVQVADELLGKK